MYLNPPYVRELQNLRGGSRESTAMTRLSLPRRQLTSDRGAKATIAQARSQPGAMKNGEGLRSRTFGVTEKSLGDYILRARADRC
jgi:hypothetical protein